MQRRIAYIHAGSVGAGESQLQAALAEHEETLRDAGVICPLAGRIRKGVVNHRNLVFSLTGNERFNPGQGGIDELGAELRGSDATALAISAPQMAGVIRMPRALAKLRAALAGHGFRIRWVVYLRTYEDWLQQLYVERLFAGKTGLSCEAWVAENRHQPLADPCAVFAPLFGADDEVAVRSFSLARGDVAGDFLGMLGSDLGNASAAGTDEENLGHPSLKVRLHQMLARFAELRLSADQAPAIFVKAREAEWLLPESPPFRGLGARAAAAIRAETRASYQELLRLAGVDTPFDGFFPPVKPAGDVATDVEGEALLYQAFVRCALG